MKQFIKDGHAELDISQIIGTIIAIAVAGILIAALLPSAVNQNVRFANGNGTQTYMSGTGTSAGANVTNWSSVPGLGATYDAIPIMVIIAALMIFITIAIKLTKG